MLPAPPDEVQVTVPHRRGLRARPGVHFRLRDLALVDRSVLRGLGITEQPPTVLETAVPVGSEFLDRVLQRHVRFDPAYRAYCRNLGAHGGAEIGRLLTAAADRADSAAERLLIALLRGAGLIGWEHGRPFGPWTIDFAFPGATLAVKVDGWAWHMDLERFRADRHKGNALARAKWDLLRFTWHDLTHRPEYVLGEIRTAPATAVLSA